MSGDGGLARAMLSDRTESHRGWRARCAGLAAWWRSGNPVAQSFVAGGLLLTWALALFMGVLLVVAVT